MSVGIQDPRKDWGGGSNSYVLECPKPDALKTKS